MRQSRNEGPKVWEAPEWDNFEGKKTSPAEEVLIKKRRCGYNQLRVVESSLPGVGYGLFEKVPIVKAGGCRLQGVRPTKDQTEHSKSESRRRLRGMGP